MVESLRYIDTLFFFFFFSYDECLAGQIPMNVLMGTQPIAPPYTNMLAHIAAIVRTTVVQMRKVDASDVHITLNRFREVARLHGQATDPVVLTLLHDVHQFRYVFPNTIG